MSTQTMATRTTTFKIGWIALLVISVLMALNHIMLIFVMRDESLLFIGWAAFNLVSTALLYIPFRRGEKWAWYTSWILVIGFAVPMLFTTDVFAVMYLIIAVVMALALFLTRSAFFQRVS